jgi:hypothetical protein
MKPAFLVSVLVAALFMCAGEGLCGEDGLSLGYGFAAFNRGKETGEVEGDKSYDFAQVKYLYELPFQWKGLALLVEPFASYVADPATGTDLGVGIGFKYYLLAADRGLYIMGGSGMAYSTIGFQEQGTHLFFIGQGGVGYRFGRFFIEDRFRHYSNGGTAAPNWSVNANIFSVGTYF